MRRIFALSAIACSASILALVATALPAAAESIVVSPTSTTTSGTVTVSGDVLTSGGGRCAVGDDVTLISNAFVGHGEFAGEGAVVLPVDASGHFSSSVTLNASVASGTYTITGRCGGGNLGVSATLTVGGLPRTGASFGPFSTPEVVALCIASCALGLALTGIGRRRALSPAGAGGATRARR